MIWVIADTLSWSFVIDVCSMLWNKTPVTVKRLHQLQVEASCADLLIKENDYML